MENEEIKEIGKYIDSINMPRKRSSRKRHFISIAVVFMIACSFIVSGALLSYYGKVTTTANVGASIQISEDGSTWLDYYQPIERTIPTEENEEMVHCTYYCYKNWIRNRACADGCVDFEVEWIRAPDGDPTGYEINQFLFGEKQTIRLVQKEVDWGQSPWVEKIEPRMEAELTFGTCGKQFSWSINDIGNIKIPENYVLVYYANYNEYWEGAPAFIIGGLSGSADIPSMPYANDENALRPISEEHESYLHQYGAKFWLVPGDAVVGGDVVWERASEFLFETDLGFYMECDETEPEPLQKVWNAFNIIDCAGNASLKSGEIYCLITFNHVAFEIMGGIYTYNQLVIPTRCTPAQCQQVN